MATAGGKRITVVFYNWLFVRPDWQYALDSQEMETFLQQQADELTTLGIQLDWHAEECGVEVNGYGDLLNGIRIRSSENGLGNPCLGHILGPSPKCDLFADLRRGINRVAFAPETIEPDAVNKQVCHNCGCGC